MLQEEFHRLVEMEVSQTEFEMINSMYTLSDVDKYTFCYHWAKINENRIIKFKTDRKIKSKKMRLIGKLCDIHYSLKAKNSNRFDTSAKYYFNKAERKTIEDAGIQFNEFDKAYTVYGSITTYLINNGIIKI